MIHTSKTVWSKSKLGSIIYNKEINKNNLIVCLTSRLVWATPLGEYGKKWHVEEKWSRPYNVPSGRIMFLLSHQNLQQLMANQPPQLEGPVSSGLYTSIYPARMPLLGILLWVTDTHTLPNHDKVTVVRGNGYMIHVIAYNSWYTHFIFRFSLIKLG